MNIYYYLHSHWDREWYLPFESYRLNLIAMVEDVINKIKTGELESFVLDGQVIILEDIQEIDESLYKELKTFIDSGKISIGPWYVLGDQSLVSGESIIRNLDFGLKICKRYDNYSKVGYCPDTFGHCSDLPRLLNLFKITTAVVWRGMPKILNYPLFQWRSYDDSTVTTLALAHGYYNTLLNENENMAEVIKAFYNFCETDDLTQAKSYIAPIDAALLPFGGDHTFLPDNLKNKINFLKENLKDNKGNKINITATTLNDFFKLLSKAKITHKLTTITGELRSNEHALAYKRAYLLYGVLSTRIYLKILNRKLENLIFKTIEPLFVIIKLYFDVTYPFNQVNYLIKLLLRNQPHDSICGCSIDTVHREMIIRYEKAFDLALALKQKAITAIMEAINDTKPYLYAANRNYIDLNSTLKYVSFINTGSVAIRSPQTIEFCLDNIDSLPKNHKNFQIKNIKKEYSLFINENKLPDFKDSYIVSGYIMPSKEVGSYAIISDKIPWKDNIDSNHKNKTKANLSIIHNEFYELYLSKTGDLSIYDKYKKKKYKLKHYFESQIDAGDTYNFDFLPGNKPVKSEFSKYVINESGSLVNSVDIYYKIKIPGGIKDFELVDQSIETDKNIKLDKLIYRSITHEIVVTVTLKQNTPIVFFETKWQNRSKDHRLCVVFKLDQNTNKSISHNHFSLIEREHNSNNHIKKPVELGYESQSDKSVCEKFFIAADQLFLNNGLPEYEVINDKVKITLLRAVSRLSAKRLFTRGGGAGPPLRLEDANCLNELSVNYAWSSLNDYLDKDSNHSINNELAVEAYKKSALYENKLAITYLTEKLEKNSLIKSDDECIHLLNILPNNDKCSGFIFRALNITSIDKEVNIEINYSCQSVSLINLNDEVLEKYDNLSQTPDLYKFKIKFKAYELLNLKCDYC